MSVYNPLGLVFHEMDALVQVDRLIFSVGEKVHVVDRLSFQDMSSVFLALAIGVTSLRNAE